MKLSLGEKIIGAKRLNKFLTPNSTINKLYLISETYSKIVFYKSLNDTTCHNFYIVGIEFDGILIGKKSKYHTEIDKNENNIFQELEIQTALKQSSDNPNLYWQYITYINIKIDDTDHKIGFKQNSQKIEYMKHYYIEYAEPEIIKNCIISGVGIFNNGVGCFQIIYYLEKTLESNSNITKSEPNSNITKSEQFDYDILFDGSNKSNDIFYNRGFITLVDACVDSRLSKDVLEIELQKNIFVKPLPNNILDIENLVMDFGLIGIENYEVFDLFMLLFNRQMKWTSTNEILLLYYPNMLNIIEKAVIEKNYKIVNAVFRIDRMINHFIYLENNSSYKPTAFHKHKDLIIKIKHMWQPLVLTMQKVKQIQLLQVSLNCYHVANISKNKKNRLFAFICFICQIALMVLLGLSVANKNFGMIFPLVEGRVVIPLIFIFTIMVVYKQISNTIDFYKIFPNYTKTLFGVCDILSNVISSLFILFFNFFVLSFNDQIIDIVLNSVASLFIINLDDNILFETPDKQLLLIKNKVVRLLNYYIDKIPNNLFNNDDQTIPYTPWKVSNGVIKLNTTEYMFNDNLEISPINKHDFVLDDIYIV
jgi:hypothetical protein